MALVELFRIGDDGRPAGPPVLGYVCDRWARGDCEGATGVWRLGCVHEHARDNFVCARHLQDLLDQIAVCSQCAHGPCSLVLIDRAGAQAAIAGAGGPW